MLRAPPTKEEKKVSGIDNGGLTLDNGKPSSAVVTEKQPPATTNGNSGTKNGNVQTVVAASPISAATNQESCTTKL